MRRPGVFTLDYSHPLAQDLTLCGITGATGLADESLRHAVFTRTGLKPVLFEDGTRMDLAPVAGGRASVVLPSVAAGDPFTVSWKFWRKSFGIGNSWGRFFDGSLGVIYNQLGGSQLRVESQVLGYPTVLAYTATLNDSIHTLTAAFLPSSLVLYYDGIQAASVSGTKVALSGSTSILNRADGGRTFDGGMGDILFHNRALSPAEIAILADRTDPMLGGLIVEERPVLYFDMGGSTTDELTASNLTVSSTVLGTPALGQAHALAASGITVEGPVLGAPTLTQIHALVASGLTVSSPVLGTPELAEVDENTDALFADDLVVGSPVLGTPSLGQVHALTASDLVTSSPVLGTPAVSDGTEQPSTRSGGGGGYASTTRKQKAKKKKPVVIESSTKSEREKIEEIARILDGPGPQEVADQPQSNAGPVQEKASAAQPPIVAIPQSSPSPLLITSPLDLIEREAMTAARDAATQETQRVMEEQQRIAMMRMQDEDDATALIMIFASI